MNSVGTLFIVATPIGNLADITFRAKEILMSSNWIAAEDTRHSQRLCDYLGISQPRFLSLHNFNETKRIPECISYLQAGQKISLISDAGTPLISDPGYQLVAKVKEAGIQVVPIPGPCALITALCASGLPAQPFFFAGFLSSKTEIRKKQLYAYLHLSHTVIFYEAPHRIKQLLHDMMAVLGNRWVVLARELTKLYETIHGDYLESLIIWLEKDKNHQRGEFVVLLKGVSETSLVNSENTLEILQCLLKEISPAKAANLAAKLTGQPKKNLYETALILTGKHHE